MLRADVPMGALLSRDAIERVVADALAEDAPWGDLTSQALIPAGTRAEATLVAREAGVLSGADVFDAAMRWTESAVRTRFLREDGERFGAGEEIAYVSGPAHAVLRAERVALNLVQRMSGVATLTAAYVHAVAGTGARIVDTRKTTPGLRALERHAVRCGGGHNHRYSLSDAVLVKDNHLALLGAVLGSAGEAGTGRTVTELLAGLRAYLPHTTHLEVEVDRIDQIEPVLGGGVDTIMLDNFSPEDLRLGVDLVGGRALVEASGGITLESVGAVAASGVDVISVGALTHGAPALDLGLDMRVGATEEGG